MTSSKYLTVINDASLEILKRKNILQKVAILLRKFFPQIAKILFENFLTEDLQKEESSVHQETSKKPSPFCTGMLYGMRSDKDTLHNIESLLHYIVSRLSTKMLAMLTFLQWCRNFVHQLKKMENIWIYIFRWSSLYKKMKNDRWSAIVSPWSWKLQYMPFTCTHANE